MELSAKLDLEVVALEQADELTLLVELTAPTPANTVKRGPATLQVVLDRSGSMGDGRIEGAQAALIALVDRLDPTDNLGVVAFDNQVDVVVPAGPLVDKTRTKQAIAGLNARGGTDLSAGYLRGLQEARRVAGKTGATMLLVSDGHANAGITNPDQLGTLATKAHADGVTTSTLGFGLGYDERLLAALAQGGNGNELFAEEADTAGALIAGEVDGLLDQVAQAASLVIRLSPEVAQVRILNQLPTTAIEGGVMAELGSFYAGETRKLVLRFSVPGIAVLGLAKIATLEFTHVALPDLVQHTTTLPVHVNVVPGDEAAGRIPDPEVRSEALFQQTQQAKRESSRLLSQGDVAGATHLLRATGSSLRADLMSLPDAFTSELSQEAELMETLADEATHDMRRAAKASSYDSMRKSRTRGRQTHGGRLKLRTADGQGGGAEVELLLEEWEVTRLVRELPQPLRSALRAEPGAVRPESIAREIAAVLAAGHPAAEFFVGASVHGGFTVERT